MEQKVDFGVVVRKVCEEVMEIVIYFEVWGLK